MNRSSRAALIMTAAITMLAPAVANATWLSSGQGAGTAQATRVNDATAPTAAKNGRAVSLDWDAVTLASGVGVDGYQVLRHDGSGAATIACTSTAPATTCDDTAPLMGTASYGVVALKGNHWVGPESPLTSFTFDTTAPSTTMVTSPAANAAGWHNADFEVTLKATDAEAGVAAITYSVGGGSPVTVNADSVTFSVQSEGTTTVTYSATDEVGNTEAPRTSSVKLDKTAPTVTATATGTGPVKVALTAGDSLSGVAGITYQVGTNDPVTVAGNTVEVLVTATGQTEVKYFATDVAGNASAQQTQSVTIYTDTTPPTVTLTSKLNSGAWGKECPGAGICGTAADESGGSGLASVAYELRQKAGVDRCWDGSAFTTAACGTLHGLEAPNNWFIPLSWNDLPADSTYEFRVYAIDNAGNGRTQPAVLGSFKKVKD